MYSTHLQVVAGMEIRQLLDMNLVPLVELLETKMKTTPHKHTVSMVTWLTNLEEGDAEALYLCVGREPALEDGSPPLLTLCHVSWERHTHHTQLRQEHGLAVCLPQTQSP